MIAVSETISSRGKVFGIPVGELGFFHSLLMALVFGFIVFFASCFVAIFALLIYNQAGHHTVDMADAYRYFAFPAGLLAFGAALVVMLGLWVRHKFSGR